MMALKKKRKGKERKGKGGKKKKSRVMSLSIKSRAGEESVAVMDHRWRK